MIDTLTPIRVKKNEPSFANITNAKAPFDPYVNHYIMQGKYFRLNVRL